MSHSNIPSIVSSSPQRIQDTYPLETVEKKKEKHRYFNFAISIIAGIFTALFSFLTLNKFSNKKGKNLSGKGGVAEGPIQGSALKVSSTVLNAVPLTSTNGLNGEEKKPTAAEIKAPVIPEVIVQKPIEKEVVIEVIPILNEKEKKPAATEIKEPVIPDVIVQKPIDKEVVIEVISIPTHSASPASSTPTEAVAELNDQPSEELSVSELTTTVVQTSVQEAIVEEVVIDAIPEQTVVESVIVSIELGGNEKPASSEEAQVPARNIHAKIAALGKFVVLPIGPGQRAPMIPKVVTLVTKEEIASVATVEAVVPTKLANQSAKDKSTLAHARKIRPPTRRNKVAQE